MSGEPECCAGPALGRITRLGVGACSSCRLRPRTWYSTPSTPSTESMPFFTARAMAAMWPYMPAGQRRSGWQGWVSCQPNQRRSAAVQCWNEWVLTVIDDVDLWQGKISSSKMGPKQKISKDTRQIPMSSISPASSPTFLVAMVVAVRATAGAAAALGAGAADPAPAGSACCVALSGAPPKQQDKAFIHE